MWIIAGLGNPGKRYEKTRHNIGFSVIEDLAKKYNLSFKENEDFRLCRGSIGDEAIILIEPLTFMNRSGFAISKILKIKKVPSKKLIVIHDDIDLELGRLRLRKNGSSGGHKGIESIIQHIGSKDFIRIKIGVGRDPAVPVEEYVLSNFKKDEYTLIKEIKKRAIDSIECIIREGIDKAMNKFNKGQNIMRITSSSAGY